MALTIGDATATSGLTKAIYVAMDAALRPALKKGGMSDSDIDKNIAPSWKSLSFAIAGGLVPVLRAEPEPNPEPPDPTVAETYSSATQDAAFWSWLSGFTNVFTTWAPTTADGTALKNAIVSFLNTSAVPTQLKGILR
jgi:hypothetical protein